MPYSLFCSYLKGKPPPPVRFPKVAISSAPVVEIEANGGEIEVEKEDISSKLTDKLLEDLGSPQWKVT